MCVYKAPALWVQRGQNHSYSVGTSVPSKETGGGHMGALKDSVHCQRPSQTSDFQKMLWDFLSVVHFHCKR